MTFARPFVLDEIESELPAGAYVVETEEEALEGLSFFALRRIATRITVRLRGERCVWSIQPEGLAAALAKDAASL